MTKMVPWELPSVVGGASGGYTPDPIPDPEDTPTPEPPAPTDPYDFSNAVVSWEIAMDSDYAEQIASDVTTNVTLPDGTTKRLDSPSYRWNALLNVSVSGVVANDISNVGSVVFKASVGGSLIYDTYVYTKGTPNYYEGPLKDPSGGSATMTIDLSEVNMTAGGTVSKICNSLSKIYAKPETTPVFTDVTGLIVRNPKIQVMNANGVLLQEYSIPTE